MSDYANGATTLPDAAELLRLRRGARPTLFEWLLAMLPWAASMLAIAGAAMLVMSIFGGLLSPMMSRLTLTTLALLQFVVLPWRAYKLSRNGDVLAVPALLAATAIFVFAAMMVFVR